MSSMNAFSVVEEVASRGRASAIGARSFGDELASDAVCP